MKIASGNDTVDIRLEGGEAVFGERRVPFRVSRRGEEIEAIEVGDRTFMVRAIRERRRVLVWCDGRVFELQKAEAVLSRETGGELVSPMPGRVRQVLVAVGDPVTRGQVVIVLEAMKMEHAMRAPRDGRVVAIAHREGDLVEAGVPLAEIA